eukprot:1882024-Alexandrium_andersonii.AAC.1
MRLRAVSCAFPGRPPPLRMDPCHPPKGPPGCFEPPHVSGSGDGSCSLGHSRRTQEDRKALMLSNAHG